MDWISIMDRLPEKQGTYIVCANDNGFKQITMFRLYSHSQMTDIFEHWKVTHWMPLPEPPKEDV